MSIDDIAACVGLIDNRLNLLGGKGKRKEWWAGKYAEEGKDKAEVKGTKKKARGGRRKKTADEEGEEEYEYVDIGLTVEGDEED